MDNVLRRFDMFPQSAANRSQKAGFNRLAASSNDRQATITTYIRLITRPTAGLSPSLETNGVDGEQKPKIELSRKDAMTVQVKDLCDRSRQQLLHYILNDWSRRMDIATTWLTEEWYNDKVCEEMDKENKSQSSPPSAPNFSKWAHHFLDELSAFIGSEHTKLLVRFVSEVPGLDAGIIDKIKKLALDPERVVMVVSTIHYLTLYRPPIRELCLDAIEDLWRNCEYSFHLPKSLSWSIADFVHPQTTVLKAQLLGCCASFDPLSWRRM
jgi:symplekin